jgi:hypothetical protein
MRVSLAPSALEGGAALLPPPLALDAWLGPALGTKLRHKHWYHNA